MRSYIVLKVLNHRSGEATCQELEWTDKTISALRGSAAPHPGLASAGTRLEGETNIINAKLRGRSPCAGYIAPAAWLGRGQRGHRGHFAAATSERSTVLTCRTPTAYGPICDYTLISLTAVNKLMPRRQLLCSSNR